MNILIKNTTIVDKRSKFNNSNVDILIIDGIITEIKKNLNLDKHSSKIKIVDFKNCHVSPDDKLLKNSEIYSNLFEKFTKPSV